MVALPVGTQANDVAASALLMAAIALASAMPEHVCCAVEPRA
jgi:hypothetical protein